MQNAHRRNKTLSLAVSLSAVIWLVVGRSEITHTPTQVMLKPLFKTTNDVAPFILRVLLGAVFFSHELQKVRGWFDGEGLSTTAEPTGGFRERLPQIPPELDQVSGAGIQMSLDRLDRYLTSESHPFFILPKFSPALLLRVEPLRLARMVFFLCRLPGASYGSFVPFTMKHV